MVRLSVLGLQLAFYQCPCTSRLFRIILSSGDHRACADDDQSRSIYDPDERCSSTTSEHAFFKPLGLSKIFVKIFAVFSIVPTKLFATFNRPAATADCIASGADK